MFELRRCIFTNFNMPILALYVAVGWLGPRIHRLFLELLMLYSSGLAKWVCIHNIITDDLSVKSSCILKTTCGHNIPGRSLPLIFCIHVRSGPTYWGVIYLAEKIIRWWYFTCKHVSLFYNPLFYMYIFTKISCIEYIGPYFLSHDVLKFSPVISPRTSL
jgi:hypothetical protein